MAKLTSEQIVDRLNEVAENGSYPEFEEELFRLATEIEEGEE